MPLLNIPLFHHHRREQHKELFHVHPIKHSRSTDSQTDAVAMNSKQGSTTELMMGYKANDDNSSPLQRGLFRTEPSQAIDDRMSMWTIQRCYAFDEGDSEE